MTSYNAQTLKNFVDFDDMFKGIDSEYFTPCDIADVVFEKILSKGDQARIDDVVEWCETGKYFRNRSFLNVQAHAFACENKIPLPTIYDSDDVSDIED